MLEKVKGLQKLQLIKLQARLYWPETEALDPLYEPPPVQNYKI